jgi:syntaxin 1B/2/3
MEMRNRDKAKRGIERQYQIVKPDATPEEIRQVVEGGQEVQVFAQALRQSNRVANARGVLNDVQNRHEDIKKIAQTIMELQRLFEDMATCVSRCGHAVLAREG